MNNLSRQKQIEIIPALSEGVGQWAVTRLTGCDRKTVARLALRVGRGRQELHDRLMVGIRGAASASASVPEAGVRTSQRVVPSMAPATHRHHPDQERDCERL